MRILTRAAIVIMSSIRAAIFGRTSPLQQEFHTLLRQSDAMLACRDKEGIMAGFAEGFQGQDIEGNLYDKTMAGKSLDESLSYAQTVRSQTQLREVKSVDGEAVLLTKEHTEQRIVGLKTGQVHSLVFDGIWHSIWVREDGTWKVRYQKQLSQTIIRNGVSRVVAPKAAKHQEQ